MKLEKQVCSLELAKKLKELGVEQDSQFYWIDNLGRLKTQVINKDDRYTLVISRALGLKNGKAYPAFTVAELGEMLKEYEVECIWFDEEKKWGCFQSCDGREPHYEETEADARAKMLIYLLENNLIKKIICTNVQTAPTK